MRVRRRPRPVVLAFAALVVGWSLLEVLTIGHSGLLYVAPALVVAVPLVLGRYVGEDRIAALADGSRPIARRAARRLGCRRAAGRGMHRGGRLVASSLAKRPPPARAQHLTA